MSGTEAEHQIHVTAIVEDGAVIGARTHVWHHSHIRTGSSIGSDCTIGKNVFVDATVQIGDRVKIQNNVSVYRGVTLEDEVFIGPSVVFTNDTYPRANPASWDVFPTRVREGASVGANATIIAGVEIGDWAMVAAGSIVTHPVDNNELVGGNPARRMGWICRCTALLNRTSKDRGSSKCDRCGDLV